VHALLGQGGDRIIIDMLLGCAIFIPLEGGISNYYQLSGIPLPDLPRKPDQKPKDVKVSVDAKPIPANQCDESRSPSAVTFVRSRMLYAKAALNAKGGVRFGMRHIR
jgi:telomerase reverse transcriptase